MPGNFWDVMREVSMLRAACLSLPRAYTPQERVRLDEFERFLDGGEEVSSKALRVGLERMFRRGEYLQMHRLAARISSHDLEVETYLNVAAQAVEQLKLEPK